MNPYLRSRLIYLRSLTLPDHTAMVRADLQDVRGRVACVQKLRIAQGRKQTIAKDRLSELADIKRLLDALLEAREWV